jgi:predicted GIY-YIG superfamily endonuclease
MGIIGERMISRCTSRSPGHRNSPCRCARQPSRNSFLNCFFCFTMPRRLWLLTLLSKYLFGFSWVGLQIKPAAFLKRTSIFMSDSHDSNMSEAPTEASSTCRYFCYTLFSGNHTYAGYTVDLKRRLRQHNGELSGGARRTSVRKDWRYLTVMTSPAWTAQRAMQVEYLHKYPTRRKPRPSRFSRPLGRARSMAFVVGWIPEPVNLFVDPEFFDRCVQDLRNFSTVQVRPIFELFDTESLR